MVHKIFKTYLPAISMAFTATILLAGIISWMIDKNTNFFAFEVLIYLIVTCILDAWIGKINFKTYLSHFIVESILIYPITIFFGLRFRWFCLSVENVLICSLFYLVVMIGIHLYFYALEKNSVAQINHLLEEGRKKNG